MHRKDYILIAEALRKRLQFETEMSSDATVLGGVRLAASSIADALATDNSRFNREHFMAVIHGEKDLNSRPARRQS